MESEDKDRERKKKSSHLLSVLFMPRTVLGNLHAIALQSLQQPYKKGTIVILIL